MKIESTHIINRPIFKEIIEPKVIIEDDEYGAYLIYHEFTLNKIGTNIHKKNRMLTIYDSNNLELKSHIKLNFPLNDYAFSVDGTEIFLASGRYDGGYSYEGELLRVQLIKNKSIKVLKDRRDFRSVSIVGNNIITIVQPTDDMNEDQTRKLYSIPINTYDGELKDFEYSVTEQKIKSNFEYDTEANIERTIIKLEQIASTHIKDYVHYYSSNVIKYKDERELLLGLNKSKFANINLLTQNKSIFQIKEKGNCCQIISTNTKNEFLLNFFPIWPRVNHLYKISNLERLTKQKSNNRLFYRNSSGHFVAKQFEAYPFEKKESEIHYDQNMVEMNQFRIGNYNGYQHHLNASDSNNFYFFQGIDDNKYTKKLIKYSIKDMSLTEIYEFTELEQFVNINAAIHNNQMYLTGSQPIGDRNHCLLKLDLKTKKLSKIRNTENQIIQIELIGTDKLLYLDIDGNLSCILLSEDYEIVDMTKYLKTLNQQPTCFDINNNEIAIGFSTGTVEILKEIREATLERVDKVLK